MALNWVTRSRTSVTWNIKVTGIKLPELSPNSHHQEKEALQENDAVDSLYWRLGKFQSQNGSLGWQNSSPHTSKIRYVCSVFVPQGPAWAMFFVFSSHSCFLDHVGIFVILKKEAWKSSIWLPFFHHHRHSLEALYRDQPLEFQSKLVKWR